VLILIPWWIVCHFSLSLRSPTPGLILQAGLLNSPEKSFSLPIYADAMALWHVLLLEVDLLVQLVLAME
jgi:hypothetical protein